MARRSRSRRSTGYRSRKQWRLFFADPRLRKYARRKARATKGGRRTRYRRLPTYSRRSH